MAHSAPRRLALGGAGVAALALLLPDGAHDDRMAATAPAAVQVTSAPAAMTAPEPVTDGRLARPFATPGYQADMSADTSPARPLTDLLRFR